MNGFIGSFKVFKHRIIEKIFTCNSSKYLSPLIEYLVLAGALKVWDGVYSSWEDAPQDEDVLEEKIWVNKVIRQVDNDIDSYESGENLFLASSTQDFILSLTGGMLLSSIDDDLRILDFGGGMGISYFPLISSVSEPERVDFYIVEVKTICNLAKSKLAKFSKLHFCEKLPELSKPVHIIHAGSSIQYIPDWKGLLSNFANYRPQFLILEDVPAGNIPTFVTTQNFYGKKVRSRFLNIDELIDEVRNLGYQLIYKSRCTQNFLGKVGGPLPMNNFPTDYQLNYGSHLMFGRVESLK